MDSIFSFMAHSKLCGHGMYQNWMTPTRMFEKSSDTICVNRQENGVTTDPQIVWIRTYCRGISTICISTELC